ncbi:hypothetical protein [Methanolacinia petrolearia]|nr:hypothetical protein [Methanolacinia petrolearia]
MLKEVQKRDELRTIIICLNQPQSFLMDFYGKNGIDMNRVFFVDAITKYATGSAPKNIENCLFVSRPGDLTSMSIAVTSVINKFKNDKIIIFLDSVNALLIHTNSVNLTKFIHFIISKLRVLNISGIFLAVEKGLDPILLNQIMLFADEMVEFPDGSQQ